MGLYTRKDYERDLAEYDAMRVEATRALLAGTPIDKRRIDDILDEAELKAKRRLVSTGLIITDRQKMRRSAWFAWVWWGKGEKPTRLWRNGQLSPVAPSEVRRIANTGVTIFGTSCKLCKSAVDGGEGPCDCKTVFLKRGGRRTKRTNPIEQPAPAPVWVEVNREQYDRILALGGRVWTCPSGKLDDKRLLTQDMELLHATSSDAVVPPTCDMMAEFADGSQAHAAGAK